MIRAIVVYYNGKEVPNSTVDKIVSVLATDGIAEGHVETTVLTSEDMSKIIIPPVVAAISNPNSDRKVQAACKYVKERFKGTFTDTVAFAISITNAVAKVKNDGMRGNMLFEAIHIISESGADCIKYGLPSNVINVIKQVNEDLLLCVALKRKLRKCIVNIMQNVRRKPTSVISQIIIIIQPMYRITVTSAEKKTLGSILFVAKYNSQKEANQARSQLIKMAGERRLAPADVETGHTVVYAKPRKWHVGEVVK